MARHQQAGLQSDHLGTVEAIVDLGEVVDYHVRVGAWAVRTKTLAGPRPGGPGDPVAVRFDPDRCYIVAG